MAGYGGGSVEDQSSSKFSKPYLTLAQERLHKAFIAVVIALLIGLMITTLAVMVQTGVIAASTWVLGNTLALAFLSLAAHLGMMTLGPSALIALLVLSTWFIAGCVVEMSNPGFFASVLGLSSVLGLKRTINTHDAFIYRSVHFCYGLKPLGSRLGLFGFIILTFPVGLLCVLALYKLAESRKRPVYTIAGLWILNFIFRVMLAPFFALSVVMDTIWTEMCVGWRALKSLRSGKGEGQALGDGSSGKGARRRGTNRGAGHLNEGQPDAEPSSIPLSNSSPVSSVSVRPQFMSPGEVNWDVQASDLPPGTQARGGHSYGGNDAQQGDASFMPSGNPFTVPTRQ